jgi:hypothetical protein
LRSSKRTALPCAPSRWLQRSAGPAHTPKDPLLRQQTCWAAGDHTDIQPCLLRALCYCAQAQAMASQRKTIKYCWTAESLHRRQYGSCTGCICLLATMAPEHNTAWRPTGQVQQEIVVSQRRKQC